MAVREVVEVVTVKVVTVEVPKAKRKRLAGTLAGRLNPAWISSGITSSAVFFTGLTSSTGLLLLRGKSNVNRDLNRSARPSLPLEDILRVRDLVFIVEEEAPAVLVLALAVEETATTATSSAGGEGGGGSGAGYGRGESRGGGGRRLGNRERGKGEAGQELGVVLVRLAGSDGALTEDGHGQDEEASEFETHFIC